MIRALIAWSWLVSATGTALMVAPHVPLLAVQAVLRRRDARIGTSGRSGSSEPAERRTA